LSNFTDIVEYIVDTMIPDHRFNGRDREKAIKFLTVEIASLIQDSHNDNGELAKEADTIMTTAMDEENE